MTSVPPKFLSSSLWLSSFPGAGKLPEVGKFLGRFYFELKKGIKEVEKEIWEEETQKEKKQKKSFGE